MNTENLRQYFTLSEPAFLDETYQLTLTDRSKELFEMGKPGQAYVGIVDLETREVHLYPAFNKNDGLERVDKQGGNFHAEGDTQKRFVESKDSLGARTGDLHEKAVSELGLVGKSGSRKMVMGFGLWKAGVSVKFVTALPPPVACIPDELYIVKVAKGWEVHQTLEDGTLIPVGLSNELLSLLNAEPQDRKSIEDHVKSNLFTADTHVEHGIKYIKNRSTSQNTYSCVYSEEYKLFFKSHIRRHAVHERDLERELPFSVFQKIMSAVGDKLEIPACKDLTRKGYLNNPMIPHKADNLQLHFDLEREWKDVIQNIEKSNINSVADENKSQLIKLIFSLPQINVNTIESVVQNFKEFTLTDDDLSRIKEFIYARYDYNKNQFTQIQLMMESFVFLKTLKQQNDEKSFEQIIDELNKINRGEKPNVRLEVMLLRELIQYGLGDLALNAIKLYEPSQLVSQDESESLLAMALKNDLYDVAHKLMEKNSQVDKPALNALLKNYLNVGCPYDQIRLETVAKMIELWTNKDDDNNELFFNVIEQCVTGLHGRPEAVVRFLKENFDLVNMTSREGQTLLDFYCMQCKNEDREPSQEMQDLLTPEPKFLLKDLGGFDKKLDFTLSKGGEPPVQADQDLDALIAKFQKIYSENSLKPIDPSELYRSFKFDFLAQMNEVAKDGGASRPDETREPDAQDPAENDDTKKKSI